jgi:GDPmannose 4,6-dehydratase
MSPARRALITGVTGQDGWYLAQQLLEDDCVVFGLIHPSDERPIPAGVTAVTGDLVDSDSLLAAVSVAEPDELYNLAGLASVALAWREPVLAAEVTGVGLIRLVEATRAWGDPLKRTVRVVQASSAEMFGDVAAPQDESTPIAPVNPYGAAKAFAHQMAGVYRGAGVPVSTAILYNHESPRRESVYVTRRITEGVARIAKGSSEPLRLGNLEARRDWGYAPDYMSALRLIARHERAEDFVIATGVSHTVADFVAAAFAHVGITDWRSRIEVDQSLVRAADAGEQRGDATKAHTVLGWAPRVSFEQVVAMMVDTDLALLAAPAN